MALRRYLSGELSLRDFNRWFLPASRNVHRSGNAEAERLVGDIGLALSEFQAGHRTETELRDVLERVAHIPGDTARGTDRARA